MAKKKIEEKPKKKSAGLIDDPLDTTRNSPAPSDDIEPPAKTDEEESDTVDKSDGNEQNEM